MSGDTPGPLSTEEALKRIRNKPLSTEEALARIRGQKPAGSTQQSVAAPPGGGSWSDSWNKPNPRGYEGMDRVPLENEMSPAQRRARAESRQKSEFAHNAAMSEMPIAGPLYQTGKSLGRMFSGTNEQGKPASSSEAFAEGVNVTGGVAGLPFTVARSLVPGAAQRVVDFVPEQVDKYVGEPLSRHPLRALGPLGIAADLIGGEHTEIPSNPAIRSMTNLLGTTAAFAGLTKGAGKLGGAALDAATMRGTPDFSGRPGLEAVRGSAEPGRFATQPVDPNAPSIVDLARQAFPVSEPGPTSPGGFDVARGRPAFEADASGRQGKPVMRGPTEYDIPGEWDQGVTQNTNPQSGRWFSDSRQTAEGYSRSLSSRSGPGTTRVVYTDIPDVVQPTNVGSIDTPGRTIGTSGPEYIVTDIQRASAVELRPGQSEPPIAAGMRRVYRGEGIPARWGGPVETSPGGSNVGVPVVPETTANLTGLGARRDPVVRNQPMQQSRVGDVGTSTKVTASEGLIRATQRAGFPSVQEAQQAFLSDETASMMLRSMLTPEQAFELESLSSPLREAQWSETRPGSAQPPRGVYSNPSPTEATSRSGLRQVTETSFPRPRAGFAQAPGAAAPMYRAGVAMDVSEATLGTTSPTEPGQARGYNPSRLVDLEAVRPNEAAYTEPSAGEIGIRGRGRVGLDVREPVSTSSEPGTTEYTDAASMRGKSRSVGPQTERLGETTPQNKALSTQGVAEFAPDMRVALEAVGSGGVSDASGRTGSIEAPAPSQGASGTMRRTNRPQGPTGGQNAPGGLPEGSTEPGARTPGAIEAGLSRKIDLLKQYGEGLFQGVKKALGETVEDQQQALSSMNKVESAMSSKERAGITRAFLRGEGSGTPAQEAFRKWWRGSGTQNDMGFQEQHRKYQVASGVRVTDKNGPREAYQNPNYVPQDPTPEAVEALKNNPEAQSRFYERAAKQGLTREQADAVLKSYNEPGLRSYHGGSESPRDYVWPDEDQNPNVLDTIDSHIRGSIANATEHRVFGYRDAAGAGVNPDASGRPQGKLGDMLARISSEGDRQAAHDLVLNLLGRDAKEWSSQAVKAKTTVSNIGAVNALRLYGLRPTTALVQFTQNAMTNTLVGTPGTAKAVYRVTTDYRGALQRAIDAGAVHGREGFLRTLGMSEESGGSHALGKVTHAGMEMTYQTDLFSRLVASEAAPDFAAKLKSQLNGNRWRAGVAETNLKSMDFSPQEIQRFKEGNLTIREMNALRRRMVEITQGDMTNANRISLATRSTSGRLFMQGKGYTIEQARNSWRLAGRQLIDAKNPLPAARMLAGHVLLGYGIKKARDLIYGSSDSRPDNLATDAQQGGFGGVAGDAASGAMKGQKEFFNVVDNLTDAQVERLGVDLAKLGVHVIFPPTDETKSVGGTQLNIKKSRGQILMEAFKRDVPSAKEWMHIENRVFGGDTNVKEAQEKKAKQDYNKSKRVELDIVR